jgi:hypothetical protein
METWTIPVSMARKLIIKNRSKTPKEWGETPLEFSQKPLPLHLSQGACRGWGK